jgi:hypothetical protein
MKDLILNFSWDKLFSLPPTEFLAFGVVVWVVYWALLVAIQKIIQVMLAK